MSQARAIPGLDDHGFMPFAAIRATANRLKVEEFAKVYNAPALHVVAIGDEPGGISDESEDELDLTPRERSFRRTLSIESGDAEKYDDRVAFLVKRPPSLFPNIVSLGRAMNSDIVIDLSTISKIHGLFLHEGEKWIYQDKGSTNGTLVDGKKLKPEEKAPLADGSRLRLGLELTATFLLPPSLHARAKGT